MLGPGRVPRAAIAPAVMLDVTAALQDLVVAHEGLADDQVQRDVTRLRTSLNFFYRELFTVKRQRLV